MTAAKATHVGHFGDYDICCHAQGIDGFVRAGKGQNGEPVKRFCHDRFGFPAPYSGYGLPVPVPNCWRWPLVLRWRGCLPAKYSCGYCRLYGVTQIRRQPRWHIPESSRWRLWWWTAGGESIMLASSGGSIKTLSALHNLSKTGECPAIPAITPMVRPRSLTGSAAFTFLSRLLGLHDVHFIPAALYQKTYNSSKIKQWWRCYGDTMAIWHPYRKDALQKQWTKVPTQAIVGSCHASDGYR